MEAQETSIVEPIAPKPGEGDPRNIRRRRRKAKVTYKTVANPLAGVSTKALVELWFSLPKPRPKKAAWQSRMAPGSYLKAPAWKPSERYKMIDGKMRRVDL